MADVPRRSQRDGSEHAGSQRRGRGGKRWRGGAEEQRDFVILRLPAFALLLLLLSVCDDVADVLVVYVASNIWGEGGPHVLDLREKRREYRVFYTAHV